MLSLKRAASGRGKLILQLLRLPILLILGYLLVSTTADTEIQDAFQYRLNLEQGLYSREETQGYFGQFVIWLNTLLPSLDPFFVVGALTAAIYLHVSLQSRVPKLKYAMFLLLLVMPLVSANFTQVLRQGLASGLILIGLTVGSSILFPVFLIAGAMLHKVFAPVVATLLFREFYFRDKRPGQLIQPNSGRSRLEDRFDKIIFVMIPIAWLAAFLIGSDFVGGEKYFAITLDNSKRIVVSALLLICVRLVYPTLNNRLSVFMAYITISIASILPVAIDFFRLHTVALPFIAIAALTTRGGKNGYYALAICILVSMYVIPTFGLTRIF
jgi:hypothetical protein